MSLHDKNQKRRVSAAWVQRAPGKGARTCVTAAVLLAMTAAGSDPVHAQERRPQAQEGRLYGGAIRHPEAMLEMNVADGFTIASVGDTIYSRPIAQNPESGPLKALLSAADVATANCECVFYDIRENRLPVNQQYHLWPLVMHPSVATHARAARYFDTPRGRVASAAGTNPFLARPLLAPDELQLFGGFYKERDPKLGNYYKMNEGDKQSILKAIRNGKANADFLVATIHAHEQGPDTQDFLIQLARESIDNGADSFVGHGPHALRGVGVIRLGA